MTVKEVPTKSVPGTAVQALVRQVTPDPIASTASYALIQRMGEDRLQQLRRREFWSLTWTIKPDKAKARTEWLFETSSVFVHPSKHRWQILAADDLRSLLPEDEPGLITGVILVTDLDAAPLESTRQSLAALYPECAKLTELRGGTWWELAYKRSDGIQRVEERLRCLAETHSRTQGFFTHPHYQTAEIVLPCLET